MILTLDVGNTNISIGAYDGDTLAFVSRLATDRSRTADQYAVELRAIFWLNNTNGEDFSAAVISSVVPELTAAVSSAIERVSGIKPLIIAPGIKTGLNIQTDNPAQVGADLIAGAVAAAAKYPLPCLVVDLGTATKISVIDSRGAFCGCTISAGIGISLEALYSRASQLPGISLDTPRRVVGKNTIDSMTSGTVYGAAAMIDGMCDRINEELDTPVKSIVATGGFAAGIVKQCKHDVIYNGELLLEGLKIIYERNK
ncbi:MAG: type III pantothenate kinase [Clostridiales bacterium]|nr:type III pantothenate kinase [Clostridiales bacterium]